MAYMALEDVPRGLVKIALPEKTKNLPYWIAECVKER
jgi:hypothetical protein